MGDTSEPLVRYAVLGAGWISQEAFMPGIAASGNSAMTAICTGNQDAAGKLAAFYGISDIYGYEQFDEMIASGKIDAVYNALPNSLHAAYSIKALDAGIHVLVEKPMAVSVEECEAMMAAAKRGNAKLMVAYRLHNEPGTLRAMERIDAGEIGEPRLFSSFFTLDTDPKNHRLDKTHWGGPLQDIGIYCINAARHIFKAEPQEVVAIAASGSDARFQDIDENVAVTMRFSNGRLATFTLGFGTYEMDQMRVAGTKGALELDPAFHFKTGIHHKKFSDGAAEITQFDPVDQFAGLASYFSDCILNDEDPEADGHEGLADVTIALAIEKAIETGQMQKIDLPPRQRHPSSKEKRAFPTTDRRLLV